MMNRRYLPFAVMMIVFAVSLVYIPARPVTAQSSVANDLLALVNDARADVGAPPLTLSCPLNQAAQMHLEDMVQNNFFSHTGSDGSSSQDRALAAGYGSGYVGENIAWNYYSAQSVFDGWMGSTAGHRENILNNNYDHMGLAYDPNTRTWVQSFGGGGTADCPPYDLNNDGYVTPTDAMFALNRLNTNNSTADVDQSGTVTPADVQTIIGQIGQIVP